LGLLKNSCSEGTFTRVLNHQRGYLRKNVSVRDNSAPGNWKLSTGAVQGLPPPNGATADGLEVISISGDTVRAPSLRKDYTKRTLNIATFTVGPPFKLHFKGKERDLRKEMKFCCRPKLFYRMQKGWQGREQVGKG